MNQGELIAAVAKSSGLSKRGASAAVKAAWEEIGKSLKIDFLAKILQF